MDSRAGDVPLFIPGTRKRRTGRPGSRGGYLKIRRKRENERRRKAGRKRRTSDDALGCVVRRWWILDLLASFLLMIDGTATVSVSQHPPPMDGEHLVGHVQGTVTDSLDL